jgi:hypothetical protein
MIHCINCTSHLAILVLPECLTLFVFETCHTPLMRSREWPMHAESAVSASRGTIDPTTQPFDFKRVPSFQRQECVFSQRCWWVLPCSDITARTVIKCLTLLFSLWDASICTFDRGPSLVSQEVRAFLSEKGVTMRLPTILPAMARWWKCVESRYYGL